MKKDENSDLHRYYSRRVREYEAIYNRDDPVRQGELAALGEAMRAALGGRRVLEVACGTGYWTRIVAEVARQVTAVDFSSNVLAAAREKGLPPEKVEFRQADAYALDSIPGTFNAGLANFWFSHVPRARIEEFLDGFHRRLGTGAVVFLADNVYVPGIGGKLVSRPDTEDTYKIRELADRSTDEVLKNYYDEAQLQSIFGPRARGRRIHMGKCFWWFDYRII